MSPNIKLKRSAIAGRIPTTDQLDFGEIAINTADGRLYIKRSVGGTETIVSVNDSLEGVWKQYSFTATEGQTTFSGSDDNSQVFSYSVGYIEVNLNGVLLDPAVDFVANTGYSVELTIAAVADDLVQINSFSSLIGPGDIVVNNFSGDNSTVSFSLSTEPGVKENISVFLDGVYQEKETYSISGLNLVLSEAPPLGTSIEVIIGSRNLTITDIEDFNTSGNISASGTISGSSFSGTAATFTNTLTSGSINTGNISSSGAVDADGAITTTSNVNTNNLNATGDVIATGTVSASGGNSNNWNTAFSWGDHADEGYLTSISLGGLSDVLLNETSVGDVLKYNGVQWVNDKIDYNVDGGGASAVYLASQSLNGGNA